jgi:hypothetical protein
LKQTSDAIFAAKQSALHVFLIVPNVVKIFAAFAQFPSTHLPVIQPFAFHVTANTYLCFS